MSFQKHELNEIHNLISQTIQSDDAVDVFKFDPSSKEQHRLSLYFQDQVIIKSISIKGFNILSYTIAFGLYDIGGKCLIEQSALEVVRDTNISNDAFKQPGPAHFATQNKIDFPPDDVGANYCMIEFKQIDDAYIHEKEINAQEKTPAGIVCIKIKGTPLKSGNQVAQDSKECLSSNGREEEHKHKAKVRGNDEVESKSMQQNNIKLGQQLGTGGSLIKNQLNGVRKGITKNKAQNATQHPDHEEISSSSEDENSANKVKNAPSLDTPSRTQRYQLRNAQKQSALEEADPDFGRAIKESLKQEMDLKTIQERNNQEETDDELNKVLKASEMEAKETQSRIQVKDSQEYNDDIQKAMQESLKEQSSKGGGRSYPKTNGSDYPAKTSQNLECKEIQETVDPAIQDQIKFVMEENNVQMTDAGNRHEHPQNFAVGNKEVDHKKTDYEGSQQIQMEDENGKNAAGHGCNGVAANDGSSNDTQLPNSPVQDGNANQSTRIPFGDAANQEQPSFMQPAEETGTFPHQTPASEQTAKLKIDTFVDQDSSAVPTGLGWAQDHRQENENQAEEQPQEEEQQLNPNHYLQPGEVQDPDFMYDKDDSEMIVDNLLADIAYHRSKMVQQITHGYHEEARATHNDGVHHQEYLETKAKLQKAVDELFDIYAQFQQAQQYQ